MFNNNNIYKLIKRAKDEICNTNDPMKKIIPNPIKFIYSFTLNSENEPSIEEEIMDIKENNEEEKYQEKKINQKKDIKTQDIKNVPEIKNENLSDNKKFIKKKKKFGENIIKGIKAINKEINIDNNIINTDKNIENDSKINMIKKLYNSKNINLWEDDESENNNKESKNEKDSSKTINHQIDFINKYHNEFIKYEIAKKSEYDKDLDKGRIKKVHKNKIGFKKHKNYFQKISNKNIKWQNKINS